MTNNKKKLKKETVVNIIIIGVFFVILIIASLILVKPMMNFFKSPELVRNWVNSHGILGHFAFIGVFVFQIIVAFIPGEPLEVSAGFVFGFWEGTLVCIIGSVLGSLIVFAFVKFFGKKLVYAFISEDKINSLKFLNNKKKLNVLVFILFAIPGAPKDLMTYFVGMTPMKVFDWIWISAVARLPSILSSTAVGSAVAEQSYVFAIVTLAITILVSVLGVLVYRHIVKTESKKSEDENVEEISPDKKI